MPNKTMKSPSASVSKDAPVSRKFDYYDKLQKIIDAVDTDEMIEFDEKWFDRLNRGMGTPNRDLDAHNAVKYVVGVLGARKGDDRFRKFANMLKEEDDGVIRIVLEFTQDLRDTLEKSMRSATYETVRKNCSKLLKQLDYYEDTVLKPASLMLSDTTANPDGQSSADGSNRNASKKSLESIAEDVLRSRYGASLDGTTGSMDEHIALSVRYYVPKILEVAGMRNLKEKGGVINANKVISRQHKLTDELYKNREDTDALKGVYDTMNSIAEAVEEFGANATDAQSKGQYEDFKRQLDIANDIMKNSSALRPFMQPPVEQPPEQPPVEQPAQPEQPSVEQTGRKDPLETLNRVIHDSGLAPYMSQKKYRSLWEKWAGKIYTTASNFKDPVHQEEVKTAKRAMHFVLDALETPFDARDTDDDGYKAYADMLKNEGDAFVLDVLEFGYDLNESIYDATNNEYLQYKENPSKSQLDRYNSHVDFLNKIHDIYHSFPEAVTEWYDEFREEAEQTPEQSVEQPAEIPPYEQIYNKYVREPYQQFLEENNKQPVEQPPVEQPPEQPPVEQPPVEQPEQPPIEQPLDLKNVFDTDKVYADKPRTPVIGENGFPTYGGYSHRDEVGKSRPLLLNPDDIRQRRADFMDTLGVTYDDLAEEVVRYMPPEFKEYLEPVLENPEVFQDALDSIISDIVSPDDAVFVKGPTKPFSTADIYGQVEELGFTPTASTPYDRLQLEDILNKPRTISPYDNPQLRYSRDEALYSLWSDHGNLMLGALYIPVRNALLVHMDEGMRAKYGKELNRVKESIKNRSRTSNRRLHPKPNRLVAPGHDESIDGIASKLDPESKYVFDNLMDILGQSIDPRPLGPAGDHERAYHPFNVPDSVRSRAQHLIFASSGSAVSNALQALDKMKDAGVFGDNKEDVAVQIQLYRRDMDVAEKSRKLYGEDWTPPEPRPPNEPEQIPASIYSRFADTYARDPVSWEDMYHGPDVDFIWKYYAGAVRNALDIVGSAPKNASAKVMDKLFEDKDKALDRIADDLATDLDRIRNGTPSMKDMTREQKLQYMAEHPFETASARLAQKYLKPLQRAIHYNIGRPSESFGEGIEGIEWFTQMDSQNMGYLAGIAREVDENKRHKGLSRKYIPSFENWDMWHNIYGDPSDIMKKLGKRGFITGLVGEEEFETATSMSEGRYGARVPIHSPDDTEFQRRLLDVAKRLAFDPVDDAETLKQFDEAVRIAGDCRRNGVKGIGDAAHAVRADALANGKKWDAQSEEMWNQQRISNGRMTNRERLRAYNNLVGGL